MLGGVASFFAFMLVVVSSPFATQVAPADGAGLNPSLQNPYMMIHPPLLYLGYVGLTIPFAFAMGALLSGRIDERLDRRSRAAGRSSPGRRSGSGSCSARKWAYEEVGWGGYYAWDPVENAALMPWLAATAFLHSVMVQEKKNMLKVWNVVLVSLAFCLSLFGTFLTRSRRDQLDPLASRSPRSGRGSSASSLSWSRSSRLALIFWRLPLLRTKTRLESLVSREAAFLYNNLLLVALTLTMLWGVAFPLLSEAVRGEKITVGAAVLQLLPARPRAAAAAADGDRPARRVAARLAARARHEPDLARGGRARRAGSCCSRSAPARAWPACVAYTFCAFVLGGDRARVRPRDAGAPRARPASWLARVLVARRRATGAATAATSSTRRSSCSRSAIAGGAYGSTKVRADARGPARR